MTQAQGGEEKSLAQQLNEAEELSVSLSAAEAKAKFAWQVAESKTRLEIKAQSEAGGKFKLSARDIDAQVVLAQADPSTELGKAWLEYFRVRTNAALAKVAAKKLDRLHWEEVRSH